MRFDRLSSASPGALLARGVRVPRLAETIALSAALSLFVAARPSLGQPPADQPPAGAKPPAGASSLDQELLDDLDNELLEGVSKKLPVEKPAAPAKEGSKASAGEKPATGDDRSAAGEEMPGGKKPAEVPAEADPDSLGEDLGAGPEDPLTRIGEEMRVVERLIAEKQDALRAADSVKAGQLQEQIIEQLAKLIERLEKEQQQQQQESSSRSGKKGKQQLAGRERVNQPKPAAATASQLAGARNNKPASDSSPQLRKNETQKVDMGQVKGLMKDLWGQLPAHAREQMLQTSPEQFLPRYELQIEKYYKRLAEQQKESH